MRHRRFKFTLPALVAMGLVSALAGAAPPESITDLTSLRSEPTEAQRARIQKYAQAYADMLGSDDVVAAGEARRALLQPLNAPGVTLVFLDAYARGLLPALEPVLADKDGYLGSMNAMQLIGQLPSQDALRVCENHCDIRGEDRVVIRIWAARGIQRILARADAQVIQAAARARAVRELGRAAERETQWPALLAQLDAIASTDLSVTDDVLLESFQSSLRRLDQAGQASDLMKAVRRSLVHLRTLYLDTAGGRQLDTAKRIMPILLETLEVAARHWDSAQNDPSARRTYRGAVRTAELLINAIDRGSGRGDLAITNLASAYTAGDQEGYRVELAKVREVLSRGPYR